MRRTFILLVTCFLGSISLVLALYTMSDNPGNRKNAFYRVFKSHRPVLQKTLDIEYGTYYIAGLNRERIYLGNRVNAAHLLVTDYSFKDTQHLTLDFPDTTKFYWSKVRVTVDSPYVYMKDGIANNILYTRLPALTPRPGQLRIPYFLSCMPLSPSSFIMTNYSKQLEQSRLIKLMADSIYIPPDSVNLQRQHDGLFSVDGMLSYEARKARLVYVYLYRNQFLCLDTNMNLLYRGNTIDTTSTAQIQIGARKPGKEFSLATPPAFVNKRSCVAGNRIFIHSALRGNNEDSEAFETYSAIDVYGLEDGLYQYSFPLPDYKNKNLDGFRVCNNKLVALYDHYVCVYQLDF